MSERRSIVIREARVADVPALTRLCGQLGYASDEAQVLRRFERVRADREYRIFVAEDATGAVVGWVQVHLTRWLAADLRGEVAGLIVADSARGHGVGRQLMQAAEAWTKEQGGPTLSLRSNVVRKEAHAFYQHLGYTVSKTSLNLKKEL